MKKVLIKVKNFFTMTLAILVSVVTLALVVLGVLAPIAFFTLGSLMMLGVI